MSLRNHSKLEQGVTERHWAMWGQRRLTVKSSDDLPVFLTRKGHFQHNVRPWWENEGAGAGTGQAGLPEPHRVGNQSHTWARAQLPEGHEYLGSRQQVKPLSTHQLLTAWRHLDRGLPVAFSFLYFTHLGENRCTFPSLEGKPNMDACTGVKTKLLPSSREKTQAKMKAAAHLLQEVCPDCSNQIASFLPLVSKIPGR